MPEEELDIYIKAEKAEVERIKRYLDTGELDDTVLWSAPGYPTHANTIMLAAHYRIELEDGQVSQTRSKFTEQVRFQALVYARRGSRRTVGAASDQDSAVALQLAYRNAVRQLIPQTQLLYYSRPFDEVWERTEDFGGFNQ